MNPRLQAIESQKDKLKTFFEANYQSYYGVLIFKPTETDNEFTAEANRLWLIKNGITL